MPKRDKMSLIKDMKESKKIREKQLKVAMKLIDMSYLPTPFIGHTEVHWYSFFQENSREILSKDKESFDTGLSFKNYSELAILKKEEEDKCDITGKRFINEDILKQRLSPLKIIEDDL